MSFPHTNASVLSQYGSIFRFVPPPDWQSLSDRQLSFFFKQLAGDLPIEEILTLSLFKWADLRVLCKTHDGKFLIKQKKLLKQEAQLSILQIQNLTKTLSFLRYFSAPPIRITAIKCAAAIAPPDNTAFAQHLLLVLVAEAILLPTVSTLPAADSTLSTSILKTAETNASSIRSR